MNKKIDQRIDRFIELGAENLRKYPRAYEPLAFTLGNCYLRKRDFLRANSYYKISIEANLRNPQSWRSAGWPNWLVDVLILSKRNDLAKRASKELDLLKKDPKNGRSPLAYYAYGIMAMLEEEGKSQIWIQKLIENSSAALQYSSGRALQAIIGGNKSAFRDQLCEILRIHDGQAKHGGLRETAEGLICMPAMSIIFLGVQKEMIVEIQSEYIAPDYFEIS